MKSETLELAGELDEAHAMELARALKTVNGVRKIAISTEAASVDIDFDGDVTSTQELRVVLQRAGFGLKKAAHGEQGSCCGSCGG